MASDPRRLLAEALKLPVELRAELAGQLLRSLDEDNDDASTEEIEASWAAEVQRRIEDLDSGRVKPVPWDEALRRIESDEEDEATR
jgi:putative addiction module component (TIGR02574 family)